MTARTAPEWIPAIRAFQEYFGGHFPHLLDDVDAAGLEMSWLENRVNGNPKETVRRSKAKTELAKIRAALNMMARHDMSYWQPMLSGLFWAVKDRNDAIAAKAEEILKFLLTLDQWQQEDELDSVLNRFFAEAEKAIEATPDTSNINWRAVHAIDVLRTLWWRNTGHDGPARALNPASRFASFLKDGFEYLEIEGDYLSAFRRWAATSRDKE